MFPGQVTTSEQTNLAFGWRLRSSHKGHSNVEDATAADDDYNDDDDKQVKA